MGPGRDTRPSTQGLGPPHPPRPALTGAVRLRGRVIGCIPCLFPNKQSAGPEHSHSHQLWFVLQKRQAVDTVSRSLHKRVCGGVIITALFSLSPPPPQGCALLLVPWAEGLPSLGNGGFSIPPQPHCMVSGGENKWVSPGGLVCSSGTSCQSELGAKPQYNTRSLTGSEIPISGHSTLTSYFRLSMA